MSLCSAGTCRCPFMAGTTIYTIILLKSVGVRKRQVAILARSSREMSLTVCIVWKHILSRVRISVRPSNFFIREKHLKPWVNRVVSVCVYFNDPVTGYEAGRHGWASLNRANLYGGGDDGVCVCARVCSRAFACVCMCACVICLQYTIIIFDPGW